MIFVRSEGLDRPVVVRVAVIAREERYQVVDSSTEKAETVTGSLRTIQRTGSEHAGVVREPEKE